MIYIYIYIIIRPECMYGQTLARTQTCASIHQYTHKCRYEQPIVTIEVPGLVVVFDLSIRLLCEFDPPVIL